MSKLFYITNERGFKNEFYLLQPLRCCIQYTTLFSLRKASAYKKQTPAVLKAHRGLMAIPILFLFQGTTASRHRHQRLDAMRSKRCRSRWASPCASWTKAATKEAPARGIDAATLAAETGHAQPSTTLVIYTQVYHKQPSSELYEKQKIAAMLFRSKIAWLRSFIGGP